MHKQVICTISLLAMIGIKPAIAMETVREYVPSPQIVGQARMSLMFWDIYDAILWAPEGHWDKSKPFALQLSYLRHIEGRKIADHSIQEMRGQGFDDEVKLATWHTQMQQIFPDINEGDILTGIFTTKGQTIFLNQQAEIGRINDPEFTKYFSGIWLSPKTSTPDLRVGLLGMKIQKGQNHHEILERNSSHGTNRMH